MISISKKQYFVNFFLHAWGTTLHKLYVFWFLFTVALRIIGRSFKHDMHKYNPIEAKEFMKVIHLLSNLKYGTTDYKDCLEVIDPALKHHYAHSRHHPEFWNDKIPKEKFISGMNLLDIIEMYCDWKAATKRHKTGDMFRSIAINQERFNMSEELCNIFRNTYHKDHYYHSIQKSELPTNNTELGK